MQMYMKVIYSNTLRQMLQRVLITLWQKIEGHWQPSDNYMLFAEVVITF